MRERKFLVSIFSEVRLVICNHDICVFACVRACVVCVCVCVCVCILCFRIQTFCTMDRLGQCYHLSFTRWFCYQSDLSILCCTSCCLSFRTSTDSTLCFRQPQCSKPKRFTGRLDTVRTMLVAWLSGYVVGLWLADFPSGGHVTTSWVKYLLWVNQPGQLSLPSLQGR